MIEYKELPLEGKKIYCSNKFNKLLDEENLIINNWIKEQKCECINKLKQGKILNCEHIKKEIKNILDKRLNQIVKLNEEVLNEELKIYKEEINNVVEWEK